MYMKGMGRPWRSYEMNKTTKYMTVEECQLYRELSAKHEGSVLTMSASLPYCQLHSKIKDSSKRKPKKKESARRQAGCLPERE